MALPMSKDKKDNMSNGSCQIKRIVVYESFIRIYVLNTNSGSAWRIDIDPTNYKIQCKDTLTWNDIEVQWYSTLKSGKVSKPKSLKLQNAPRKISSKFFDND